MLSFSAQTALSKNEAGPVKHSPFSLFLSNSCRSSSGSLLSFPVAHRKVPLAVLKAPPTPPLTPQKHILSSVPTPTPAGGAIELPARSSTSGRRLCWRHSLQSWCSPSRQAHKSCLPSIPGVCLHWHLVLSSRLPHLPSGLRPLHNPPGMSCQRGLASKGHDRTHLRSRLQSPFAKLAVCSGCQRADPPCPLFPIRSTFLLVIRLTSRPLAKMPFPSLSRSSTTPVSRLGKVS